MERPVCGAASEGSGSDSLFSGSNNDDGSGSDDDDGSEDDDESHRCGCSSDSDCFQLEATLPDNLTAICEGNVCVEGCRLYGMIFEDGMRLDCLKSVLRKLLIAFDGT